MIDLALGMPFVADLPVLTDQRRCADGSPYRLGGQMSIMFLKEDCRGVAQIDVYGPGGRHAVQRGEGAGCR